MAICDTSGRLHTNWKLMEELAKCHRAIQKKVRGAPNEVLLVLDGTTGASPPLPEHKGTGAGIASSPDRGSACLHHAFFAACIHSFVNSFEAICNM